MTDTTDEQLAGKAAANRHDNNAPLDDAEKTQFQARRPTPASAPHSTSAMSGRDLEGATQIMQTAASEDRTQFAPRARAAHSAATPGDVTRFNPAFMRAEAQVARNVETQEGGTYGRLKNRFELEELLGAGGMGVVYKAKDMLKIEAQDRDPYVAIKVLTDEFKTHPEAFIALQRESRKTQSIAHPNIVTVYDFDRDGDTVFMTMEYLDGKPLDKLIAQYRAIGLPADEVHKIIEGISAALIYAHAQNIIHSDFKPGNIFVNTRGIAKVIDFGIARAVAKVEHREESADDKTVFDAGNLGALTPAYASLEMLEGKTPDVRDDIYALGCIAYELYTGVHPFNRIHADEAKRQKLKPKRIPGIKKHQWRAIEQALAFEREQRIQSVDAFWELFSKKKKSSLGWISALVLMSAALGGGYYQFVYLQPAPLSEDQVRSEIEQKLRLELIQKTLAELMATPSFSPEWEEQIFGLIKDLRQLTIVDKDWLSNTAGKIYSLYLAQIRSSLEAKQLTSIALWLDHAPRYSDDTSELTALREALDKALAEAARAAQAAEQAALLAQAERARLQSEREQQQQQAAEVKREISEFNIALETVNQQLACRSSIDMNDFKIAITKLQTLSASRYQTEEAGIVNSLAACIQKIGMTFPDRAEAMKREALRIFMRNSVLAGLTIAARDPCAITLAGLGARGQSSSCKDRITGASEVPLMVVVPAKGSINAFAIGKYEVSNREMDEFCQSTGSCSQNGGDPTLPASNLPLTQIQQYLRWLTDKSGYSYRLPNITEWQYAARASNSAADSNRNCKLNSRGIQKGGAVVKANLGAQNTWGLVNHLGNVREVVSIRGGSYAAVGGDYLTEMDLCNFDSQQSLSNSQDPTIGFRVLRELKL